MQIFLTNHICREAALVALLAASALIAPAHAQAEMPGAVSVVGATEGPAPGLLGADEDLGAALWSGSDRGRIVSLMTGALAHTDPALRALTLRILLSAADAPNGASKRALITTRISELLQAGMIAEAGKLASLASLPHDADFARVQADALLFAGRTDDVCGSATRRRLTSAEPFWLELRAYCAHASGNAVLEELTDAVLKEQVKDAAFNTLYADIRGHKADIPENFTSPTALHIFLLNQLKLPLPDALMGEGHTAANLFILQDSRKSVESRLAAAEFLAPCGALRPADFYALSDALTPSSSELQDAAGVAPGLGFVHAQLLLHVAAARSSDMRRRIALMREALELGNKAGMPFLAATLQADVLKTLQPTADADMAFTGYAQLLAGLDDTAGAWLMGDNPLQAVPLMKQIGPAASGTLQALMIRIAGLRPPQFKLKKADDAEDKDGNAGDSKVSRATPVAWLSLRLVSALQEMPLDIYTRYQKAFSAPLPGTMPDAMLMAEINTAAKTPGRHGEALLMILDTVRRVGWKTLNPEATLDFVRILRDMGLKTHAIAFAREAMLLYDPPKPQPPAAQTVPPDAS